MTSERRNFLIALVAVVLVVGALLLVPRLRKELAPVPEAAWVAIEMEGRGEAIVGKVEVPVGTGFRLHAVLQARRRDGTKLYYSEAPSIRFGDERVAAEDLVRWSGPQEVRVLWFTVEGAVPYLELKAGQTLERYRVGEFLRADWPQTWSIPGSIDPANDDALARREARSPSPFGTQRYHVRIELYDRESRLVPQRRFSSWAAADLMEKVEEFPTVTTSLPGSIGPATALFGLTQVEPAPGSDGELLRGIQELTRKRVAFSRVTLIGSLLQAANRRTDELDWRLVSLDAAEPWEGGVGPGSLLRVGDRVVVLYRDEGTAGALDRQDLCLDFAQGAVVRPLADIFVGGGEVELAALD